MVLKVFILSVLFVTKALSIDDEALLMENIDEYVDPNDMLLFHTYHKNEPMTDENPEEQLYLEDGCELHKGKISLVSRQMHECNSKLASTKASLKQATQTIDTFQDNHTNNTDPAVSTFYLRILKSFWRLLKMEELEESLSDGEHRKENLLVYFSLEDIKAFKALFNEGHKHTQIDEFFYNNFEKITADEITFAASIQEQWLHPLADLKLWVSGLAFLVLILSCWAFSLCIIDIQRNMRWTRVIGMIFFLLFVISCIGQWRIMVKNVEAEKRANEITVGPEDCILPPSYWESFQKYFTGAETNCEKYHRHILLQASEEVTPLMAITETSAIFFLQPLQSLGTYGGRFFSNFYANVPLLWAIPATFLFGLFITIILFASFGYGIEFPLWMGGIRPIGQPPATDHKQLNLMLEENRKLLSEERNALLTEAKDMLRDMSIAAISHTQRLQNEAVLLQPILSSSSGIIERQLEQIVSKRFNSQLQRSACEKRSQDTVDCRSTSSALIPTTPCRERPQDDFVSQVKNILEDSFPSDGPCRRSSPPRTPPLGFEAYQRKQSNCSDGESPNEFLAEVRNVMTP